MIPQEFIAFVWESLILVAESVTETDRKLIEAFARRHGAQPVFVTRADID